MSRLIFFAQPNNIEWAVTKLNATLHLFSQEDGLPQIESVLLVHASFPTNIIEEYSKSINKINYNIELDELIIPSLSDFSGWDGEYGLRHNDWIVLPPPGILFGKILHEVANSFDFRDGNIGFCHPSPDGETNTMYALVKTTTGLASLPDIKMKKVPLKMGKTQTLKIILEKSSNGNFNTVQRKRIPKEIQEAIYIEENGTFSESAKYIAEHIHSMTGIGFEKVIGSLITTNRDLTEIYHSVYFGADKRDAQEEDFFVMTQSRSIIWISCKFFKPTKERLKELEEEVSRLRLKPPLNFPNERVYSIVATSRRLAEKYASAPLKEKTPDVHVCHVGNLNEQISRISNGE